MIDRMHPDTCMRALGMGHGHGHRHWTWDMGMGARGSLASLRFGQARAGRRGSEAGLQACRNSGPGCWLRAGADEAADGLVQDPSPRSRYPPANQTSIPGDWYRPPLLAPLAPKTAGGDAKRQAPH